MVSLVGLRDSLGHSSFRISIAFPRRSSCEAVDSDLRLGPAKNPENLQRLPNGVEFWMLNSILGLEGTKSSRDKWKEQ